MQPPAFLQAVTIALSARLLCVKAPGVIRKTEVYTSHKDISILINRTCDNIVLINEQTFARVKGQSISEVLEPFRLVGNKMVVSQDVDFLHRILCDEPNNLQTEYRIQYKPEPSNKNTSAASQGNLHRPQGYLASVILALTLAVVIFMHG